MWLHYVAHPMAQGTYLGLGLTGSQLSFCGNHLIVSSAPNSSFCKILAIDFPGLPSIGPVCSHWELHPQPRRAAGPDLANVFHCHCQKWTHATDFSSGAGSWQRWGWGKLEGPSPVHDESSDPALPPSNTELKVSYCSQGREKEKEKRKKEELHAWQKHPKTPIHLHLPSTAPDKHSCQQEPSCCSALSRSTYIPLKNHSWDVYWQDTIPAWGWRSHPAPCGMTGLTPCHGQRGKTIATRSPLRMEAPGTEAPRVLPMPHPLWSHGTSHPWTTQLKK